LFFRVSLHQGKSDYGNLSNHATQPKSQRMRFCFLKLDYKQTGVGGDDSWGARPHAEYALPVQEYSDKFRLKPISKMNDLMKASKENIGLVR